MQAVMVTPRDDQWTVGDLQDLPDDGLRYELFDGVLVVSAAPDPQHQRIVGACYRLLHSHCPPELEALVAPLDFQPNARRSFQPDVLVARRDSLGLKNLTVAPLLAVEVLSDGTRAKDLVFKREMYQSSGVASYWVIDPEATTFTAYDLADGAYRNAVQTSHARTVLVRKPFVVEVCPADLIAGL